MADGLATNIGAILAMNAQAATKGAAEGREQDYVSKQAGVIGGNDITFEAAITKLMYLFGNLTDKNEIEKYLQISLRGEMSV